MYRFPLLLLFVLSSFLSLNAQTSWYEVFEHSGLDPFYGTNLINMQADSGFLVSTESDLFKVNKYGGFDWLSSYCHSDAYFWLDWPPGPYSAYSTGPIRLESFDSGNSIAVGASYGLETEIIYMDSVGGLEWSEISTWLTTDWLDVVILNDDIVTAYNWKYDRLLLIKRYDQTGSLLWESDTIHYFPGNAIPHLALNSSSQICAFTVAGGTTTMHRIDSTGVSLPEITLPFFVRDDNVQVAETLDSAILVVGETSGDRNIMVKISDSGSVLWSKEFLFDSVGFSGLEDYGKAVSITPLEDRGFYLVMDGIRTTGLYDKAPVNRVYRFDENGNEKYRKEWTDHHSNVDAILMLADNELIVTGLHYTLDVDTTVIKANAFIAKTDSLVTLDTPSCVTSCVWPGDANVDGIVNVIDFLYVSAALGHSGFPRPTPSIAWMPQYATNWAFILSFSPYQHYKHADTDGSGTIDLDDTIAIATNYGLTLGLRPAGGGALEACDGVPVRFDAPDAASPGDTVSIKVFIGSSDTPVSELLGAAFKCAPDEQFVAAAEEVSYLSSWLGDIGEDLHSMTRLEGINTVSAGARTDGFAVDGYGLFAEFRLILQPFIPGGGSSETVYAYFDPSDIFLIGEDGQRLESCGQGDSLAIYFINTGIAQETIPAKLSVTPNPATTFVSLNPGGEEIIEVLEIVNLSGETVYYDTDLSGDSNTSYQLSVRDYSAGMYFLRAKTSKGWYVEKLAIK